MELITAAAKTIPGFEGLYSVTKNGVVYSLPRKGRKLKILKAVDNMKAGYLRVKLSGNCKPKLYYIHQLVAMAYIPNPGNKPMVNHIDGVKTNNRLENLEWVTAQENHDHAFELGLYPEQKIRSSQKKEVYDLVQQGVPIRVVAERYGMKRGGVRSLVRRYKEAELRMAA
jgi:HNH endonuclease/NUMOD4 motif